jgi:hypothetical protein
MEFEDFRAIQNLVNSYPYLLDAGDFDGVGQLFAHAVIYTDSGLMASRDAAVVAKSYRDFVITYSDGTPRTRHCLCNLIIEPDGPNRAVAKSYVMVFQQTDQLPLQPVIGGDYADRLEKVDGVWRFVERRMSNNQFGLLLAHGRDLSVLKSGRAN